MNVSNKIFYPFVFLFCLLAACDRNQCKDTVCGYNQSCYEGSCYCNNGYEGANCDEYSADRYIGDYRVTESCYNGSSPTPYYNARLDYSSSISSLIFYNISNTGIDGELHIYTSTSTGKGTYLTIDEDFGSFSITGEGNYVEYNQSIVLQVEITQGFETRQCELVMTRY